MDPTPRLCIEPYLSGARFLAHCQAVLGRDQPVTHSA
jgi:hypothetical protein